MTTSKEQVLEMVSSGKISAIEGDALLEAMTPRQSLASAALNPFERLSSAAIWSLAALWAAISVALSQWQVRFDGAIDMHVVPSPVPLPTALLDLLVAWPLVGVVFWACTRFKGRPTDVLGFVGAARAPIVILGIAAGALRSHVPQGPIDLEQLMRSMPVGLIIIAILAILMTAWHFVWLYQGFKTASGLRGGRSAITFAVALLVAEVLSKLVLTVVQ